MLPYLVRRLALTIPTLIVVLVIVFSITRLIPGDAVDVLLDQGGFFTSDPAQMRQELGLDRPVWRAFADWTWALAHGDLGRSLLTNDPVMEKITGRLEVTVELALLALALGVLIGVPAGIAVAIKPNGVLDQSARVLGATFLAMPSFWVGTIILLYGAVWFNWSPSLQRIRFTDHPLANLRQFIVPALIIALHVGAVLMRMVRSALLETLHQDYVRSAYAKGLGQRRVVVSHALRNALLPVITVFGLQVATVFAGTVMLETVFNLPGLGVLTVDSIARRDYPLVQGIVLLLSLFVMMVNLLIDVSYGLVDPRVRLHVS